MLHDLRFAVRNLVRQPFLTAMVVGMLALGIGGNAVIFSLVDALLLRPLPFDEPERLVFLDETAPKWDLEFTAVHYNDFDAWRTHNTTFEAMAIVRRTSFNMASDERPERVEAARVSWDLFDVLRLEPILGRRFTAADDQPGAPPIALLGFGLWQERFGGRQDAVGETVRLDGETYEVVGVLPREASYLDRSALWVPARIDPETWGGYALRSLGRLHSGVTSSRALDDLRRIQLARVAEDLADEAVSPVLGPLRERTVAERRGPALTLLGAVALVLLIACANVACLTLARATARRREMGVRTALGAGRLRIVRQLLTESLVLATLGGLLGVGLAAAGLPVLVARVGDDLPPFARPSLDLRVLAFCAAVCLGTAVLCGLAPALRASGGALRSVAAAGGTRAIGERRRHLLLQGFVVAEIAIALVLLAGAGLLIRSFAALSDRPPGFRVDQVLSFRLALPESQYPEDTDSLAFYGQLRERLAALPGVRSASAVTLPPLTHHTGYFFLAEHPTRPPADDDATPVVLHRVVAPDYFETLGIQMVHGRALTAADGRDGENRVIVVNETFAEHFWPGKNAVGERVRYAWGDEPVWMTVVGVNRDVLHYGLDRPMRPGVYEPLAQAPRSSLTLVLHTDVEPMSLLEPARAAVAELDPSLPLFQVRTMADLLDGSLQARRLVRSLLGLFALVALVLASGGIYGVVAYAVGQRTREIGLRMALGARGAEVRRRVLGQGMRLAAAGLALGSLLCLAAFRAIESLLVDVQAADPLSLGGAVTGLATVAILASWMPATRAARIAPMAALRED